jgi:MHS family proline/betaine transporter-like MFS transporter
MIALGIVLTGIFTVPAFNWMVSNPTIWVYVTCVTGLTVCVMVFQGAMPSFLAELFPNSVRTTGLALIHNLNFTIVGGLSLLICTWLAKQTGSKFIPAYYVMATVAVAMCCVWIFSLKARRETAAQRQLVKARQA